jgi:hypothetical protein
VRSRKYGTLIRELLSPLAASVGLDFNAETIRPGNLPVQVAYAFVASGAQLLAAYAEPDQVPSVDKRTSKRVAKAMVRSFGRPEARGAAVFLAQAFAVDMYEFLRFCGHEDSSEVHLGFRDLIQEHFPLSDELAVRLDATRAEYRTMETHEVRDEVRTWVEIGTGYSRALLGGERDPDEDEELVEIQRSYAGTFLRAHAGLTAIELTIGSRSYAGVQEDLLYPGGPGYAALAFWQVHDAGWVSLGEQWRRVMNRAVGATLPEDDEIDIGQVDPAVAYLRQAIVERLNDERNLGLPELTVQALDYFANDIANSEVDYAIAMEALMLGYTLRVVERELPSAMGFDDQTIARFQELVADDDPAAGIAAIAVYARQVADDLPASFGEGASAWSALSAWAGRRSLDRDQARRNSGMEKRDLPAISSGTCERAFALGFGVRYVAAALDADFA